MSKPTPVAWTNSTELNLLNAQEPASIWHADLAYGKDIALYSSEALQALEEENERLREEFLSAKEAHLSITRETNARATAAEARLKEASELIGRAQQNTPEHFSNWHDAARRFITALQEKENTNGN